MSIKKIAIGVAAVVLVGFSLACGSGGGNSAGSDAAPTEEPTTAEATTASGHTIKFVVKAADGSVDMVNWSTLEDSSVDNNVTSPWSKSVKLEDSSGLVGVDASDSSRVSCELYVDGKKVDDGDSDGTVNCSDTVG